MTLGPDGDRAGSRGRGPAPARRIDRRARPEHAADRRHGDQADGRRPARTRASSAPIQDLDFVVSKGDRRGSGGAPDARRAMSPTSSSTRSTAPAGCSSSTSQRPPDRCLRRIVPDVPRAAARRAPRRPAPTRCRRPTCVMTKLQIVELNAKDRGDLYALLYGNDVADHDDELEVDADRRARRRTTGACTTPSSSTSSASARGSADEAARRRSSRAAIPARLRRDRRGDRGGAEDPPMEVPGADRRAQALVRRAGGSRP